MTIDLQIKNVTHDIAIPEGYYIVASGPVKKGDLAYNESTRGFETVKMDGNVIAQQCHLIARSDAAQPEVQP